MRESDQLIDNLFRIESTKLKSVLTHYLGISEIDLVEDIVQETLLKALQIWPYQTPDNPTAWLYKTAKNAAIDHFRKQQTKHKAEQDLISKTQDQPSVEIEFSEEQIKDDQLRMLYTACHPSLPIESQIAFALKTLFGFSVKEIAEALLVKESNIEKRLYRAKEKFRQNEIRFEVPDSTRVDERTDAVLHVLYLIFNKGYYSNSQKQLYSFELCSDALRLCLNLKRSANVHALLALFYFHVSRFPARFNTDYFPISLKTQDRNLWDKDLIRIGFQHLNIASQSDTVSYYILEATISALHCGAKTYEETDWTSLLVLYNKLFELKPHDQIYLNTLIVRSNLGDPALLIDELKAKSIDHDHSYFLILANLYELSQDQENRLINLNKALELVQSDSEKRYIQHKIDRSII